MSFIRRSSTIKHNDEYLSKETAANQSGVGEIAEIDDKKLKFKIDCLLMPML